jgi:hypothetical protein
MCANPSAPAANGHAPVRNATLKGRSSAERIQRTKPICLLLLGLDRVMQQVHPIRISERVPGVFLHKVDRPLPGWRNIGFGRIRGQDADADLNHLGIERCSCGPLRCDKRDSRGCNYSRERV